MHIYQREQTGVFLVGGYKRVTFCQKTNQSRERADPPASKKRCRRTGLSVNFLLNVMTATYANNEKQPPLFNNRATKKKAPHVCTINQNNRDAYTPREREAKQKKDHPPAIALAADARREREAEESEEPKATMGRVGRGEKKEKKRRTPKLNTTKHARAVVSLGLLLFLLCSAHRRRRINSSTCY